MCVCVPATITAQRTHLPLPVTVVAYQSLASMPAEHKPIIFQPHRHVCLSVYLSVCVCVCRAEIAKLAGIHMFALISGLRERGGCRVARSIGSDNLAVPELPFSLSFSLPLAYAVLD